MLNNVVTNRIEAVRALVNSFDIIEPVIRDKIILLTGVIPLTQMDLIRFGTMLGAAMYSLDDLDDLDSILPSLHEICAIVIGRLNFDRDFLFKSLPYSINTEYMSQEDFANYAISGQLPNYFQNDWRITQHPGLSFLSSIGFRWPSTYAVPVVVEK